MADASANDASALGVQRSAAGNAGLEWQSVGTLRSRRTASLHENLDGSGRDCKDHHGQQQQHLESARHCVGKTRLYTDSQLPPLPPTAGTARSQAGPEATDL